MNLIEETFQPIVEMANVRTNRSGIPGFVIFISQANTRHGPRVKIFINKQKITDAVPNCSYSISDNPEWKVGKLKPAPAYDRMIKDWIKMNKDVLLELWNSTGEYVDIDIYLDRLKRVEK